MRCGLWHHLYGDHECGEVGHRQLPRSTAVALGRCPDSGTSAAGATVTFVVSASDLLPEDWSTAKRDSARMPAKKIPVAEAIHDGRSTCRYRTGRTSADLSPLS